MDLRRCKNGKQRHWAANAARLCFTGLALLNAACTYHTVVDKPLMHWTPELDQRVTKQIKSGRSDDLAVMVAFSGGGTRASALAYGVLKELEATRITTDQGSRSMLQEVDIISAVSGGSFTAAYYGLHGERMFSDFEQRFLRKDVEGILFRKLFNPVNWVRLLSPSYGRSDLAADYYDKNLFDSATFTDFYRPGAPLVIINATDLATGSRIPFIQGSFDLFCADLDTYPVSRAVAASSAVPVVLSPITLENFAGDCSYRPPKWVTEALQEKALSARKIEARRIQDYLDRKTRPWLHLVDGGISDNLGLRAFYDTLSIVSDPKASARELQHINASKIIIISVNAYAHHKADWFLERYAPSLFEVIGRVSADQISRYSQDTIQLVRYTYERWAKEKSTPARPVTFYFVDVSFDHVKDDSERAYLNSIGTNFDLSDKQVDHLIAAGRTVLRDSEDFQRFIKSGSITSGSESNSP